MLRGLGLSGRSSTGEGSVPDLWSSLNCIRPLGETPLPLSSADILYYK